MSNLSIASVSEPRRWRHVLWMLCLSAGYLLLSHLLIGFRSEQLFLVALVNALYFISKATRKFILGFSIFVIYWIIFDYMKAFPNYLFGTVHIESLYKREKSLFGINYNGTLVTPNEYWSHNTNTLFDVLAGSFYLSWIPLPLMFASYLFITRRDEFFKFSLTFLWVNILGFIIYYVYPAAPPWYVQLHGFDFNAHTAGSSAGLARFDAFFNIGVFKSLYEKSSNVFAAMPSLHSAYPFIVLYYGLRNKFGYTNILFAIITVGIWCAAVYTSHHYVLDVLAGITCAAAGIISFNYLSKIKIVKRGLNNMIRYVS